MKTILFFLLSVCSVLAQTRSITVANPVRAYESLRTLAQNEGIDYASSVGPISATTVGTVATVTVNANTNTTTISYTTSVALNSASQPAAQALVPHTLEWTVNKAHTGFYYTPYATTGALVGWNTAQLPIWGGANERITRTMSGIVHGRQRPINPTLSSITDVVSGTITPAIGSTAIVSFTYQYAVVGWLMTDDFNLSATQYVDIWGDSIWYGIGPTVNEAQLHFLLREYYTDKGYNYRLRNWSIPGTITGQWVGYFLYGMRYREAPKVLVIAIGTNDVNGSVASSTISSNKLILINKALAIYPNVKIVVTAISPRLDVAKEALAVSARAAEKAAITAHPKYGSQVFYVESIGTAWTASDASKYAASDLTNGVHPVDATITGFYFPALKTFLDANPTIFN